MRLLKKDWLFDAKIVGVAGLAIFTTVAVLILIFVKVLNKMPVENGVVVYNKIYSILAFGISFYPMFAFKAVCPQVGSDKLYLSTANLPMSRKQVFFKGLKPWLVIAPVVIILGALGNVALSGTTVSLKEVVFIIAFAPIVILSFGAIIQLQIFSGIIFSLVKGLKGYTVVGSIFTFDCILLVICSIGIRVLNINTAHDPWWMTGCGLFILIASLIMFLIAWRDIEKVYQ